MIPSAPAIAWLASVSSLEDRLRVRFSNLFKNWPELLARATPRCPEVDKDRLVLLDGRHEVFFGEMQHADGSFPRGYNATVVTVIPSNCRNLSSNLVIHD